MAEESGPSWRIRASISRSVKGVYAVDATVECTDTSVFNDEVVQELRELVTLLENEWPAEISE